MTNPLIVIPYVHKPYFDECVATLDKRLNILVIDNTHNNLGVAESWNRGIDEMKRNNHDWLIVMGASMRFGEKGGMDMLEQIEERKYCHVLNFATIGFFTANFERGVSPGVERGNFSWHCTAIRRDVIEKVGYFDPNFFPIYFEDIDYDLRINKAFPDRNWLIVPIDATDVGVGHAAKLAGIQSPSEPLIAYFATKWGRHPSATGLGEYERPFNDNKNPVSYFPPAHGRLWYV